MSKKAKPKTVHQVKVFTTAYQPFIFGGDVNGPVSTVLPLLDPVPLGRGYNGYVVISPSGRIKIAEATTGAFVGDSLDQVREDIRVGKPSMMRQQVADAAELAKKAHPLSNEDFWSLFKDTHELIIR